MIICFFYYIIPVVISPPLVCAQRKKKKGLKDLLLNFIIVRACMCVDDTLSTFLIQGFLNTQQQQQRQQ